MHSFFLLLAAATTSLAFDYTSAPVGRHMRLKRDGPPPGSEKVIVGCSPPINKDGIIKASINTVDLAGAQQQLLDNCHKNGQIDPSLDNKGNFASSGTAEAQICNMSDKPIKCPTDDQIRTYFTGIQCGTETNPYMGGAMLEKTDLFFTYAPATGLGNCQIRSDTINTWQLREPSS